eukprot:2351545-Lingulodinium_polyedra.AAC.1
MAALRPIAMFQSLPQLYLAARLRRDKAVPPPAWSYAYRRGKRREMAIVQQAALTQRLAKAGRSHLTVYYDMRNAFYSAPINAIAKS